MVLSRRSNTSSMHLLWIKRSNTQHLQENTININQTSKIHIKITSNSDSTYQNTPRHHFSQKNHWVMEPHVAVLRFSNRSSYKGKPTLQHKTNGQFHHHHRIDLESSDYESANRFSKFFLIHTLHHFEISHTKSYTINHSLTFAMRFHAQTFILHHFFIDIISHTSYTPPKA